MRVPGFHGLRVSTLAMRSVRDFLADNMLTYAAALAYHVLFAIFPFIIFLVALLGFLNLSDFFDWLLEQAQYVVPEQAMDSVSRVIAELRREDSGQILSFGIILALWSASVGVRSTMHALNMAYDVDESRPAWKLYPLSIIYTIGLAAMLILAIGLMMVGPRLMTWLAALIGFDYVVVMFWTWLRWPVAVYLLMLATAIVYYVAPNVEQPFRLITPGSVLSVIIWIVASLGFGYYVRNFVDYSVTYGSFGAVIVLLLYFYISAAVLLFGAEVNAVIARHAGEVRQPTQADERQAARGRPPHGA
ncbi:MAG TPA: YihY/virulence factor BrkB family protein [Herpetosiphonaceae bacterium]